jgi:hypothetical protein
VPRWTLTEIGSSPTVSDGEPDDPVWHPLQHVLGIDTFGVNLLAATHADQILVEEHDERTSGQQELYITMDGEAVFRLDGEEARLGRGSALAITDPTVTRSARAVVAGTALLIVGASDRPFTSTWDAAHFADIRQPE